MLGYYGWREIQQITGNKHRSTIWRWERKGKFPRCRKLNEHSVGWPRDEVDAWAEDPIAWIEKNQPCVSDAI